MGEADDSAARGRELDAKLAGLEKLRLSGLVSEERYEAMRARLLADADVAPLADAGVPLADAHEPPVAPAAALATGAQAGPPPAPVGTASPEGPPAQQWQANAQALRPARPSSMRGPVIATIAAAVVLFAGAGAAAVALAGRNSSPAATTAAHSAASSTATGTPTPTPTQNLAVFGQDYLADIAPLNKAWADYDNAMANAPSGPACGCPPGEFSVRTVLPAYNQLLRTYSQTITSLLVIQQELTGRAAADCGTLVEDMHATVAAMQALFVPGTQVTAQVAAVNRVNAAQDVEHSAALALRSDLGLPPPTPAS